MKTNYNNVSIDDAYLQTMIFLARTFPHLYFLSKYLRVVYDENGSYIARTDGKTIAVTRNWLSLQYRARLAVFMHELYHVLLKHPLRVQLILKSGIDDKTANIACDAKVNYCLLQALSRVMSSTKDYEGILPTYGVFSDMLEKASVEEIAKWMVDNCNLFTSSATFGIDVAQSLELDELKQGQVRVRMKTLNEGKSSLVNAAGDDVERELDNVIMVSLISAKAAGSKLSAIEERILDSLTKSKIDWRSMLRNWVISYIRNSVVQSYVRSNRRFSELPGQTAVSRPNVWVFVDVSASVDENEFKQFMTEVVRLSRLASKVKLITWDTRVTGEYDGKKVKEIRFAGGGGTRFYPVLLSYLDKINPADVVVCLTDGCWYDVDQSAKLLSKIKAFKILVTTHEIVPGFDKEVVLWK